MTKLNMKNSVKEKIRHEYWYTAKFVKDIADENNCTVNEVADIAGEFVGKCSECGIEKRYKNRSEVRRYNKSFHKRKLHCSDCYKKLQERCIAELAEIKKFVAKELEAKKKNGIYYSYTSTGETIH